MNKKRIGREEGKSSRDTRDRQGYKLHNRSEPWQHWAERAVVSVFNTVLSHGLHIQPQTFSLYKGSCILEYAHALWLPLSFFPFSQAPIVQ